MLKKILDYLMGGANDMPQEKIVIQKEDDPLEPIWKFNGTDRELTLPQERNLIGFAGIKYFSANGKYCGVMGTVGGENLGKFALVDCETQTVLYIKQLVKPKDCHVNNDGKACIIDGLRPLVTEAIFTILDVKGEVLLEQQYDVNITPDFTVSPNGRYAIFETANGASPNANKFFIVSITDAKILHSFLFDDFENYKPDWENNRIKLIKAYTKRSKWLELP
jgi:hypothetical protein